MAFELFKRLGGKSEEDIAPEFIEIDLNSAKQDSKILVKTFVLKTYEDINPILNSLREGYTIAVIDIKALKQKDVIELKRVVSKIKKTIEALEGTIAGFGDNTIIATPNFARVEKGVVEEKSRRPLDDVETY